MTKDDIIRMVEEADDAVCFEEDEQAFYEHFAALVAAAERERCISIIYGQCRSDNVAQRTVDAIRKQS